MIEKNCAWWFRVGAYLGDEISITGRLERIKDLRRRWTIVSFKQNILSVVSELDNACGLVLLDALAISVEGPGVP